MATNPPVQPVQASNRPNWSAAAWRNFRHSIYITAAWEWFLELATRLVQPVLLVTLLYNVAQTLPGWKSPSAWIDNTAFILQNGSLDIGSLGLPKLADLAQAEGNEEGAEQARKIGKALFWVMIATLTWGSVERVLGGQLPDWLSTLVGLVFLVVRAYYAIAYTRVVHGLHQEEDQTGQGQPDPGQVQTVIQQAVQAALAPVQASLHQAVQQVQTLQAQVQGLQEQLARASASPVQA